MLHVLVECQTGKQALDHVEGPLEFGRAPRLDRAHCVLDDPCVSRDHLRIEELANARLRVENLSHTNDVRIDGAEGLSEGESREIDLPRRFGVGSCEVYVEVADRPVKLDELGESPDAKTLLHWLETVVRVQHAAATSEEFCAVTARAVVELVGLDRGLVLLRAGDGWELAAEHDIEGRQVGYSSRMLERVLASGETVFENLEDAEQSLMGIEAVVAAPVLDEARCVTAVVYGSRRCTFESSRVRPVEAEVVQVLAAAVGAGLAREREHEEAIRAQTRFEQFFSPDLARELARDPSMLQGRERVVTVLFSDLRGFTRLSEELGPRRTFEFMQEVMELQSHWIRHHDGVVVDYVGDGLLAMWNAPSEQPDHVVRACRAALAFTAELPKLDEAWKKELSRPVRLGVGVNTGSALVGNTGSRVKFKYGPMGAAVNLASRVEEATKSLGVPILITDATRRLLPEPFATRRLGRATFAGISEPVELHELHGVAPTPEWIARRGRFERALECYEGGRFTEACQRLTEHLSEPGCEFDSPSVQLRARAVEAMKEGREAADLLLHLE